MTWLEQELSERLDSVEVFLIQQQMGVRTTHTLEALLDAVQDSLDKIAEFKELDYEKQD